MPIGTHFSVAVNGNIRHAAGASNWTVLEFHRWLQDLADDAIASGDDLLDITSSTPSERATDNIITLNPPYNIDDTTAEYLYDGSIQQNSGGTLYSGLVVVGSLAGTSILQIVQDNSLYDGDAPFWDEAPSGINSDAGANILMRCMVKTRTAGADVDQKKIRVYAREWGDTFAEFEVTMGLGNSVAAIFTNEDLNNTTSTTTVEGWSSITNNEGYQLIDLNNGSGDKPYYSKWDKSSQTINDLYERAKWLTMRGTSQTIHGVDGELFRGITHEWAFDGADGVGGFTQNETLSWGTGSTAGTGLLLAMTDLAGTAGTVWIQLLTGVPPTDPMTITGGSSSETHDINGDPTTRAVSPVFLGQSTGTSLIGAFGIGATGLTNVDKLFDLNNDLQQPPNNVYFNVYGLVSGDRLLATNADGSNIDFDQMSLNTALDGAAETTVDVGTSNIPTDTPSTGILRIQLDSGVYRRIPYTSHDSDDEFTIAATSFDANGGTASASNNVFIGYLDQVATAATETFSLVYNAQRTIFVRVRDGGATPIKTFEGTAPLGTGGGSATANRISDE